MKLLLPIALLLSLIGVSDLQAQSNKPQPPKVQRQVKSQTATTESGRKVILNGDGTWVYAPAEASVQAGVSDKKVETPKPRSIYEVKTNQESFINIPIVIVGEITLDDYYNDSYLDQKDSYFSFDIVDADYDHAHVYMPRNVSSLKLRKLILENGAKAKGTFTIEILRERYSKDSKLLLAELLNYKISSK